MGEMGDGCSVLARVHSECLTGDIFSSRRCDCGPQLNAAMARVQREGRGVIVYLRGQEGRGIGLGAKLQAYNLQDGGRYGVCQLEGMQLMLSRPCPHLWQGHCRGKRRPWPSS